MSDQTGPKKAFILMPFDADLAWLHDEIRSVAVDAGIRAERADDIFQPGAIIDQVQRAIEEADVIIAVLTGHNPNVFLELGLAWHAHKPVLIADNAETLPFDVRHLRHLFYGAEDSIERMKFAVLLKKHLDAALDDEVLPRGRRLSSPPAPHAVPRLDARVSESARNSHRLEVVNKGTITMHDVTIEFPEGTRWRVHTEMFPSYPIRRLEPAQSVKALLTTGGLSSSPSAEVTLRGTVEDGDAYEVVIPVTTL